MAIRTYGVLSPPGELTSVKGILKSGEIVADNSAKFVNSDGNGKLTFCTSSSTKIVGFADVSSETLATRTLSSDENVNVITDLMAVFRVPFKSGSVASQTALDALKQSGVDLDVTANIQTVNLAGTTNKIVIVVGGDYAKGYVEVVLNPSKIYA